jgi:hypothetical protein
MRMIGQMQNAAVASNNKTDSLHPQMLVGSTIFKMVEDNMLMGIVPILIAAMHCFLVCKGLGGDGDTHNPGIAQQ